MKKLPLIAAITGILACANAHALSFNLSHEWTFNHTAANGSKAMGSEIVSFDAASNRLWIVGTDANEANLGRGGIDVLDMSGKLVHSVALDNLGVNSVAVKNGQAAVAITGTSKLNPGTVRFYDTGTFAQQAEVSVGANPDSVTYTPDGSRLLVANEGEPLNYTGSPDPAGSVSIINTSTFTSQTAGFTSFDGQEAALKAAGVRLNGPTLNTSQNVEPEYVAISADGKTAFATLQEANSVAKIDIASATVTGIIPMGLKDHSLPGNGIDASDRDGPGNNPLNGKIQNWKVSGMYMPDVIASFENGGNQFYVTANEGDARSDWPGFNDEVRVGAASIDPALNTAMIAAHGADWRTNNDKLNRLNVSTSGDTDGDLDLDRLEVYGARSFSILDKDGKIVFDSGDQIEQIIKASFPALWDDSRSDNKGPEPESVAVWEFFSKDVLFVGLERSNAIMMWDISNFANIEFIDMLFTAGDVGPEGLNFFSNNQGSFLAVANEVSETTTLYRIEAVPEPATLWLFGAATLAAVRYARRRAG
jgi:3-phytase